MVILSSRWIRTLGGAFLTLLTLYAAAHTFFVFNDAFLHNGLNFDESYFAWCGWSILRGLVLYKDFLEYKPPLVFLTHALALKLYGFEHFEYRQFFAYFPLASLLALQVSLISRKVDRFLALALTIGIIFLWVNPKYHDTALSDSESIGLTYYMLGVACLLARTPFPRAMQYLGGAFFACTLFSKEPFLPCVGMTWISCALIDAEQGTFSQRARGYAIRTLGGGVAVLVLLCIWMVPSGSMKAYIEMASGYARFYRDVKQSYCVVLGRFHPTTPWNDLHVQWREARGDYLNTANLGYLVPIGAASLVCIFARSRVLFASVMIGFAAALWAVTASNCQWMHYYTMAMSGLVFALAVGLDSLTPHYAAMSSTGRGFLRLALLGGIVTHVWPVFDVLEDTYGTRTSPAFNAFEPLPGAFKAVAENTKPTDLIVTTGEPSLYMQVNRTNGIRESTADDEGLGYYEGKTDVEKLSGIRAELIKNRPKLIILDPTISGEARRRRWHVALWDPFLAEFHYKEIAPKIWLRPD